tara:strand:+ start:636 stop:1046 length:411 start_codon:yes stop_codon:yes gene_type:complete
MSSILKVNTLTGVSTAGSIVVTGEGNSTTTNLQQGLLKHWVNFNMANETVNDSFNNTTINDIGGGDYTVTIASNFANAVYAISFEQAYVAGHGTSGNQSTQTTKTTTLVRVYAFRIDTGAVADTPEAMVHSAGDLA